MAGLDIYSSQSLFRSGHVLLICVGRSVCHAEGYPNHFGSLWMFPRLSRLPASPCARIKAHFCPRPSYLPHITTAIPKHSTQLSHPAIFYLALSLPAVPYRPSSWPFAAKANSRCHLKEGKHREWWVLAAVNQRYEFRTKATCCSSAYLPPQAIDFEGEVNLFHFYLLRSVGKGAFGKVCNTTRTRCTLLTMRHIGPCCPT